MIMLSVFGLGILVIDLLLPTEWRRANAWTALIGIGFATAAVWKLQLAYRVSESRGQAVTAFMGFGNSVILDRFAIYFFYLFLAGAAIAVLISVKYLDIEREQHGEFYALVLFSVVGMMAMASGYDVVLLFIGLEL